jgi:hypothetical protein
VFIFIYIHENVLVCVLFMPVSYEFLHFFPLQYSNDKGKSSGGAWGSGRLKNSGGGSSNEGGGKHRPPPGMDGGSRKDFGSERRSSSQGSGGGGWGRSGSNSSNGYAKKTYPPATQNSNNNNNNTQNNQDNSHQHILRERFLHLILSMVGQNVTLTQTSGRVLEGIFHTFSPFNSLNEDMRNMYCLKAVRVIKKGKDGSDDKPVKDGTTVLINANKVANVQVKSMRLDAVTAANDGAPTPGEVNDAAFATDSQISGGRGGNQSLVAAGNAWTAAGDGGLGGGLESSSSKALGGGNKGSDALNWRRGGATPNKSGSKSAPSSGGVPSGDMKGSIGDWDQFSANEKKFGVKTSFDENLYTTKLDHSKMDDKKRLEAERIAKEIEGTVSTNIHIATERNQALAMDFDDEDLYSGVLTKDLKARVVPASDKKGGKLNFAAAAKKGTADTPPKDGDKGVSEEGKSPPDLSKMKISSEEKKENEGTDQKSDNKSEDDAKKEKAKEKNDEKKSDETKLKLNPNAKTFSFNPGAKTFTPTFSAPASAAPMQALPPMDGQMMPPQEYPGGAPMMGGMGAPQYPMPGEYIFLIFLLCPIIL